MVYKDTIVCFSTFSQLVPYEIIIIITRDLIISCNKDFYSAISVGSWRFTTEYFEDTKSDNTHVD